MNVVLCAAEYRRPLLLDKSEPMLLCHYLAGHDTSRHSWQTLADADDYEVQERLAHERRAADGARPVNADADVQVVLDWINQGDFDTVLEAILASAHNRKRTLRNVRGFPDLERRMDRRQQ